jgi:hypothetical protein
MPKTVVAEEGSTLCQLAIAEGHLNCQETRKVKANEKYINQPLREGDEVVIPDLILAKVRKTVDSLTKFLKKNAPPVDIRFVRGEHDDRNFASDFDVPRLHVSNYVSNRAGQDGTDNFPSAFGCKIGTDPSPASYDEDAFRIEVTDPAASGSVNVKLETLRPVFDQDGKVTGYRTLTGVAEADRRKIDAVECQALPGAPKAFRSRYLRLVTNKEDHEALKPNKQGLLISDLVDDGDEQVEIVGQKVRASYVVATCPCTPKCTAVAERLVGPMTKKVRLAVHILKKPADNQPVMTSDAVRKQILRFVRRYYAQAEISVRFVPSPDDEKKPFIREVPAPSNIFEIGRKGLKAQGGKTIKVGVEIDGMKEEVEITTDANDYPVDTATKLVNEINGAFVGPVARVSGNKPLKGKSHGSADIVVGDPAKQAVVLSVLTNGDGRQKVRVARLTSEIVEDFDGNHSWIGTPDERLLVKNYSSGTDRIDLFIVGGLQHGQGANLSTNLGEAFRPRIVSGEPVDQRPIDEMINSVIMKTRGLNGTDFQSTLCHEFAHVLMDMGAHPKIKTEILSGTTETGVDESPVNGPKRVSAWELEFNDTANTRITPVQALRSNNTGVLDGA